MNIFHFIFFVGFILSVSSKHYLIETENPGVQEDEVNEDIVAPKEAADEGIHE